MSKIDFNSLNQLEVKNEILYHQLYPKGASVFRIYSQWVCFPKKKKEMQLITLNNEGQIKGWETWFLFFKLGKIIDTHLNP